MIDTNHHSYFAPSATEHPSLVVYGKDFYELQTRVGFACRELINRLAESVILNGVLRVIYRLAHSRARSESTAADEIALYREFSYPSSLRSFIPRFGVSLSRESAGRFIQDDTIKAL